MLRVPPYCFPEKMPTQHIERDLFEAYSKIGIEVEAYVPTPTRGLTDEQYQKYKSITEEKVYDGLLKVHRFSMFRESGNAVLKGIRYLLVNLKQYRICKNLDGVSVISSGSTPPTQGILCGIIKKRLSKRYGHKVPFVYSLQDIFPDSLVTTGMTKKGSIIWKIGRKIENYTYENADKIIVISQSMKRNIIEKGVPEEKIEVISNWINTDTVRRIAKENNRLFEEFAIPKDKFIVLYAGNFGSAQGADVVLKAAELLKNNCNIQFVIFGGGAEFEKAKATVKEKELSNVIINGLLPQDRISEVYSLGDVALITCKKGVGTSGMPSKTWSIMACNTPIIASFDTDSELAEIIREANAGVCVEPENAEKLSEAILNSVGAESFNGGRDYVMENASRDKCVARYVDAVKACMEGK